MREVEGRFARQKDGAGYAARVLIALQTDSKVPGITFCCAGEGWFAQGYLEDATADGYNDWKAGAKAGIEFALQVVQVSDVRVVVKRITGMTTDTNPTIVAAAAAKAVWSALDFEAPENVTQRMENLVFSSWQRSHDAVPTVLELTRGCTT